MPPAWTNLAPLVLRTDDENTQSKMIKVRQIVLRTYRGVFPLLGGRSLVRSMGGRVYVRLNSTRSHKEQPVPNLVHSICILALAILLSSCQGYRDGSTRTVGEFTDDTAIQTAVKTALIRDDEIKGFPMNIEVYRGVVSLYGRIPSEQARTRALGIAGDVRGVVRVEDRLTLVRPE